MTIEYARKAAHRAAEAIDELRKAGVGRNVELDILGDLAAAVDELIEEVESQRERVHRQPGYRRPIRP